MWIAIILFFALAVLAIVFLQKRNSIDLKYTCPDGEFRIKGKKQNLKIYKGKRFVFNIKGNDYRLIVLIKFTVSHVLIRFVGTHEEYDKIKDIQNI